MTINNQYDLDCTPEATDLYGDVEAFMAGYETGLVACEYDLLCEYAARLFDYYGR